MVECVICLETAKKPVKLPCKHQFCGECFEGWRSKYVVSADAITDVSERQCPCCRATIPPSKEQVSILKATRSLKQTCEERGDQNTPDYRQICEDLKKIEAQIGKDWDGVTVLEEETTEQDVVMPGYIAHKRDLKTFMRWFDAANPAKLDRANARLPDGMRSIPLLTFAIMMPSNIDLMRFLMQRGADVNKQSASGATPLSAVCEMGDSVNSALDHNQALEAAKLLLSWGANYVDNPSSMGSKQCCILRAQAQRNNELVSILQSELCGRRCELVDLSSQSELNGRTCVVEEYIKTSNQYVVTVEGRKQEMIFVSPDNLKRRDRTRDDCGYYIEFKNGRFIRNDFDSKDEYQAFLSSMNRDEEPAVDPNAEAKAEQAAANLLAELGIEDDVTEKKTKTQSNNNGKKNKKKGKKGKKK
mmetsp:Transcript_19185/g.38597  ORF Transcript_19185/g.38597 Transcript_19185/m.38597 type:complete len:416 (+) Transcript_19185:112-1359(+)